MLRIMPTLAILTSKDEPPYDKNGKVTPVTGTRPITTHIFKTACKISEITKPNERYLPNKSLHSKLTLSVL